VLLEGGVCPSWIDFDEVQRRSDQIGRENNEHLFIDEIDKIASKSVKVEEVQMSAVKEYSETTHRGRLRG